MTNAHIPYGRQTIDDDDIAAVVAVLRSDYLTQGPAVARFEEQLAAVCGARHAVCFANGTAALHTACLACDLGPGDGGLVPPISFAATANCLLYTGATPHFVDVTPGLPLLDPDQLPEPPPPGCRVILPVHFSGAVCDMTAIARYAATHQLRIIEDACHALGARYTTPDAPDQWHTVGACAHSDLCVFSFHPVKSITTGEGGAVTTNDDELAACLRRLRQHGIIRPDGPDIPAWQNDMVELGFNFRLTDVQAALGSTQLAKLDRFIAQRTAHMTQYAAAFQHLPTAPDGQPCATLLVPSDHCHSAHHLCVMCVTDPAARDPLLAYLRRHDIGAQLHYRAIYRHPLYHTLFGDLAPHYPNAEDYWPRALSLPLYPTLTDDDRARVMTTIRTFFTEHHGRT